MTRHFDYGSLALKMLSPTFTKDSLWLLLSQVVMAAAGIGINSVITLRYGAEEFGSFALALKIYLIMALVGSVGTNVSALRYSAKLGESDSETSACMSALVLLSFFLPCIASILIVGFAAPAADALHSISLEPHLKLFAVALPLFCVNKTLFGILNGSRKIRTLAILQGARSMLLLAFIAFATRSGPESALLLTAAFPATEAVLLSLAAWILRNAFRFSPAIHPAWMREHLRFGWRSMISYVVTEANTNIDVFLLGAFKPLAAVGTYSFAADIAKNLFAVADAFASSFHPIITTLHSTGRMQELKAHIDKLRTGAYRMYLPLICAALALYPSITKTYLGPELADSIPVFVIISLGVLVTSGYRHVNALFDFTGFPEEKLKVTILSFSVNAVLSMVLIYRFGIIGAAAATSLALVLSVFILNAASVRVLGLNLMSSGGNR